MGTPDLSQPFCMSCGKVAFPTREAAESSRLRHGEKGKKVTRSYRCGSGNGWHLTSSTMTKGHRR